MSKGGIVIFYHVAKTGGSTIRSFFTEITSRSPSQFKYHRYLNFQNRNPQNITCANLDVKSNLIEKDFEKYLSAINDTNDKYTYLWEIHGGTPGLNVLLKFIDEIRASASIKGKEVFAFTIVREPISHTLSYFKFFHMNCTLRWCEHLQFKSNELLEKDIKNTAKLHPNQQCFLLKYLSSIAGLNPTYYKKCKVTKNTCQSLYNDMKKTLDWVGTTNQLSFETLPLLKYLLQEEDIIVQNQKISRNILIQEDLSNTTMEYLHNKSMLDQNILCSFLKKRGKRD